MKMKLFLCFRPIAVKIEAESDSPDSFGDPASVSTPTTPARNRSPKTRPLTISPPSAVESENETPKKTKCRRKSFSGFPLFEISSKKKGRDRKAIQIVSDSRINDPISMRTAKSAPAILSSASTEPSPVVIQKKHIIHQGRHKKSEGTRAINGLRNSHEGMLLILINIVITVLYGRLCAVLFTCLFLYSVCRLRSVQRLAEPVEKVAAMAEAVERDYRKRVIMEGLLQRDKQQGRRGH